MATLNERLAEELKNAGTRLLSPPSVDNLPPLLNEVVRRLELVEQSPSQTMLNALSPSMKALVKDQVKPPPNKEFKESGSSTKVTAKSAKKGSYTESSKKGSDQKNLKRKRASGKEEALETAELGEELVGCRIKVWWPDDIMFYEAVVESFIPDTKRHKILYTDGDVEELNMKKEIWEFNKDDEQSLSASLSDGENPEASSERKLLCMIRRLEAMEQKQFAIYREFKEFHAEFREFHAELRRHQDEQSRTVAAMNQNKE